MSRRIVPPGGRFMRILCTPWRILCYTGWIPFLLLSSSLSGQTQNIEGDQGTEYTKAELEQFFSERYGPDQKLYNGVRYYNLHELSEGHKFLGENRYQEGKVVIDGQLYDNLQLKYDIYKQQVILLFEKPGSGYDEIIINNLRLEEFQLGGKVFRKYYFPETDTLLFQVHEGQDLLILNHFYKRWIWRPEKRSMSEFSLPKRRTFILIPSGLHEISNNRSFAGLFPEQKKALMTFLRGEKIKIRRANDLQLQKILVYCNQIMNQSAEAL